MASKTILVGIGILQLMAALWAGGVAFADTTAAISTVAMMGMLGSVFHSLVLFASVRFPASARRTIAGLLLAWHIPETLLLATFGMGVPVDQRPVGIATHAFMSVLALLAWHFAKPSDTSAHAMASTNA